MLLKMNDLPASTELKDKFLIQAAFKDDPYEEVGDFWKRGPEKDVIYTKRFRSELFLSGSGRAPSQSI